MTTVVLPETAPPTAAPAVPVTTDRARHLAQTAPARSSQTRPAGKAHHPAPTIGRSLTVPFAGPTIHTTSSTTIPTTAQRTDSPRPAAHSTGPFEVPATVTGAPAAGVAAGGPSGSSTTTFAVLIGLLMLAATCFSRLPIVFASWRPVAIVSLIERPG